VRKLKLRNVNEWRAYVAKSPSADLPKNPDQVYAGKGWAGYGDWLGTGTISNREKNYRSFRAARAYARALNLRNWSNWKMFCAGQLKAKGRIPADIPRAPQIAYKGRGWKSVGDWLGTRVIANTLKKFRSFGSARKFARSLRLRGEAEWRKYLRNEIPHLGTRPADIPANPAATYRGKGWAGMGDWLGTGNIASRGRKYRSFRKARAFARKLGLKSRAEWFNFCKGRLYGKGQLPADIPKTPDQTYAHKGWAGMGDWLGTGNIAPRLREYRPFRKARAFARGLKLENTRAWIAYTKSQGTIKPKLPEDITAYHHQTSAEDGWTGMDDWLGTGRKRRAKRRR
jgi:hypothetical protein